jgi:hypothetical protein
MPVVYEPSYSYYAGVRKSFSDKLHVLNFKQNKVYIYTFLPVISGDDIIPDSIGDFFDTELDTFGRKRFFTGNAEPKYYKFDDIVETGLFNFYENPNRTPDFNLDILKLVNQTVLRLSLFGIDFMDPNVDYGVAYNDTGGGSYEFYNFSDVTKNNYLGLLNLRTKDVFSFNTGFGNVDDMTKANINISPSIGYFFSNLNFQPNLVAENPSDTNEFKSLTFPGKIRAKITGPATANVGDVVEYTVTLMNYNLSNTFTSPQTVEVYPLSSAGAVSHRKVSVVNGTGKFKLDTSNLYSGDVVEVKVGWKYITGDTKLNLTLS